MAEASDENALLQGWHTYVETIRTLIVQMHGVLTDVGVPYAYACSIFLFTLCVKILVLPLNWKQTESTMAVQKLQPRQQALKKWFGECQPAMNMETANLYAEQQVNPLAGCLPAFAQIPIFIGLYRAIIGLSKDNVLTESFLWLPTLEVRARAPTPRPAHRVPLRTLADEPVAAAARTRRAQGPVADYGKGIGWLTENWVDGHPSLGWHDTLCYLSLPLILVITQSISMRIMTPPTADQSPEAQQTQAVIKFLPLMIGWFALSAPAGLGLYWFFNNLITTTQTVALKAVMKNLDEREVERRLAEAE